MALGGEVDHRVDFVFTQQASDQFGVGDVALDEDVARIAGQTGECVEVAGIGQPIEVDHPHVGLFEDMMDEVAADEAGAARDQEGLHVESCL